MSATTTADQVSNVNAFVTFERLLDKFRLSITVSDPQKFATYYEGMHPGYAFIYDRIPGGAEDSTDIFVRVMSLGDMESIPIDKDNSNPDGQYRSNLFSNTYDDVQEAIAARELLLHDLHNTYSDIATVGQYSGNIPEDMSLRVPTDTNKKILDNIKALKTFQQQRLYTIAHLDAKAVEMNDLKTSLQKARVIEQSLNTAKLGMEELGTPSEIAAAVSTFNTFRRDAENVDDMFLFLVTKANELLAAAEHVDENMTKVIDLDVTPAASTVTTEYQACKDIQFDLSPTGGIYILADGVGEKLEQLAVYEKSLHDKAIMLAGKAYSFSTDTIDYYIHQQMTDIIKELLEKSKDGSPARQSSLDRYMDSRDNMVQSAIILSNMLNHIGPSIAALSNITNTIASASGRIVKTIAQVQRDIDDYTTALATVDQQISDVIGLIEDYMPGFNPDNPAYAWCVTINIPE